MAEESTGEIILSGDWLCQRCFYMELEAMTPTLSFEMIRSGERREFLLKHCGSVMSDVLTLIFVRKCRDIVMSGSGKCIYSVPLKKWAIRRVAPSPGLTF